MESKMKRDLASTSSGQPTESKRPRFFPIKQEGNNSERTPVLGSRLTDQDVQRVGNEVLERVAANSAEFCQSKTSNGLESDLMAKGFLTEEDIGRVAREQLEPSITHLAKLVREQSELLNSLAKLVSEQSELRNSQLLDLRSCMLNTLKGVVPQTCSLLEDTSQRVVREESEHTSSQSVQLVRPSGKCRKMDKVRNLRLQFKTKLPSSFYNGQKLTIDVELVNANTGNIVKLDPEVEVVVLQGDFGTGGYDKWTQEGFEKSVVREREGKRPLLIGNLVVNLNRGAGVLGDVRFTDNSSWTRSKKFRLGLRASPEHRENIREAITEPFTVKESRGQAIEKHVTPAPGDEVWRLKNIARNGPFHNKLSAAGIGNVGQFLQLLDTDPKKLRKILGEKMTKNKWDDLLSHAKPQPLNGNQHVFLDDESDQNIILDNGRQFTDHTADQLYHAADKFSLEQEEHGDTIVKKTFVNWNNGKEPNDETCSMQEKGSSSFPSQVSEGQIQNLTPVQHNLAPGTSTAPVGLQTPPVNASSTAKVLPPGQKAATLALPVQSQYSNYGNAFKYSACHTSHLAGQQPISADGSNVLFSPEDYRYTNVVPHDINSQRAMPSQLIGSSSQMVYTEDDNVFFSEPPHALIPFFQSGSTFPPLDGNRVTAEIQSTVSDDGSEAWLADIITTDDTPTRC